MKESYRIWDRVKERWLSSKDRVFVNLDGEKVKIGRFGHIKKLNQQRYLVHYDIGFIDENKILVYEGDFVNLYITTSDEGDKESIEKTIVCTVGYIPDIYSYVLFDIDNPQNIYFLQKVMKIKVIGNVFDTPEILKRNPDLAKQVNDMKSFTITSNDMMTDNATIDSEVTE